MDYIFLAVFQGHRSTTEKKNRLDSLDLLLEALQLMLQGKSRFKV